MKLEIYNDTSPEPEKVVRLRLVREGSDIMLVAVDEDGKPLGSGSILQLGSDGKIFRRSCVSSFFGFDIDNCGRVKTN